MFVSAGWGWSLFRTVDDPVRAVPLFVLMTIGFVALGFELHTQAQRRTPDRWTGSDTAIIGFLVGYATVICLSIALRSFTPREQSAGASVVALNLVGAAYFGWQRRATLARK
jgi:hypothetical protein